MNKYKQNNKGVFTYEVVKVKVKENEEDGFTVNAGNIHNVLDTIKIKLGHFKEGKEAPKQLK